MKKIIFYFLITSAALGVFAQKTNYKSEANKKNANYYEIVKQVREEFSEKNANAGRVVSSLAIKKSRKQFNRWAYYWGNRINPDGTFPNEAEALINAGMLDEMNVNANARTHEEESWINVGPKQSELENNNYPNYPQMGRINAFLRIPHPSDANKDVLFFGAPNGGIWKSTDGGKNWSPKTDYLAAIGITDIKTISGSTTENYTSRPIYVSTGDYDGGNAKSIGVIKSTDGGETFKVTGNVYKLEKKSQTGDLVVIDANTVFVGQKDAILKTVDGGKTWTDEYKPSEGDIGFGRAAQFGKQIMYTDQYGGVIYTNDYTDKNNWEYAIEPDAFSKTAVTVSESGDFYIQDKSGQIKKFDASSKKFTNIGNAPANYNSQDGYNQTLIVTNDLILSGEIGGNVSTDNGNSWYLALNGYWENDESTGKYVHSDHHRAGKLSGEKKFWLANDGGLNYVDFSSDMKKPTIEYKTGNAKITQLYSVAINPKSKDGSYIISNQDNDAMSKIDGKWYAVAAGDGIQSAINYNDTKIRYSGNQSGLIGMSDTGFKGQLNGLEASNVEVPGAYFYYPLEMSKVNPDILFVGGGTGQNEDQKSDVHKITRGSDNQLEINALNSGLPEKENVKTIATHDKAIVAATKTSIRKTVNDGGAWTAVKKPEDVTNITSVDFKATDSKIIYVTNAGYLAGKKIYKSTDGGEKWKNISGDLPNVIVNEVMLKQNQSKEILFVATNLGVYFSINEGTNWKKLGKGLPNVDVKDIEIHYTEDKLVAGTFGRGLWEINIKNETLGISGSGSGDGGSGSGDGGNGSGDGGSDSGDGGSGSGDDTKPLGIDETVFSVYPNPVKTELFIKIDNESTFNYELYNVVGGILKAGSLSKKSIDVSDLSKGAYMIRVYNSKQSFTRKIIKVGNNK